MKNVYKIQVAVRVRPLLSGELSGGETSADWQIMGLSTLRVPALHESTSRKSGFIVNDVNRDVDLDFAFGPGDSTEEVFARSIKSQISSITSGFNIAVMAYGQTASGKTFSMFGPDPRNASSSEALQTGIAHFALRDLFAQMDARSSDAPATVVRMSYFEIYQERVNDLLRRENTGLNLPVRDDPQTPGGFRVQGLKERVVWSYEELLALLEKAERRRACCATRSNEDSSRSHSILRVLVEQPLAEEGVVQVGSLTLVDLAGSERNADAGSPTRRVGAALRESSSINKSLFFLTEAISRLSRGQDTHFRDSKLTQVLAHLLGGNAQTTLLVTLHPGIAAVEQSMSSLRLAAKAGRVTQHFSHRPTWVSSEAGVVQRQRRQIQDLQRRLAEGPAAPDGLFQSHSPTLDRVVLTLQANAEWLEGRLAKWRRRIAEAKEDEEWSDAEPETANALRALILARNASRDSTRPATNESSDGQVELLRQQVSRLRQELRLAKTN